MLHEEFQDSQKSTEQRWYALYMKHHHEKKAAEVLSRKGIEVFLPIYQAVHRWKDRRKSVSLPLFPGYLFVRTDLSDKLRIVNTPGVFFVVENAGRACPVSDSEIEAVKIVMRSGGNIAPHEFLQAGERVRVQSGPLAGVLGFFVREKNQSRIVVSVEVLRKAVSVEVDISNVVKMKAAQQ
jgi:transcription antitermination factor NusG